MPSRPPVKAVSFDCGDTLVQVTWDPPGFALACAERSGVLLPPDSREHYTALLQQRWPDYWAASRRRASAEFWKSLTFDWLGTYGYADSADRLMAAADRWMFSDESPVYRLYPETRAVLEAIHRRGLPMIVLSNWDDSLNRVLAYFGIDAPFQEVLASMVEGVEKPDPAFFSLAEGRLGLDGEGILHVGDRRGDDYEAALAAGWQALHVVRPDNHAKTPYGSQPGHIRDLTEVLAWI